MRSRVKRDKALDYLTTLHPKGTGALNLGSARRPSLVVHDGDDDVLLDLILDVPPGLVTEILITIFLTWTAWANASDFATATFTLFVTGQPDQTFAITAAPVSDSTQPVAQTLTYTLPIGGLGGTVEFELDVTQSSHGGTAFVNLVSSMAINAYP